MLSRVKQSQPKKEAKYAIGRARMSMTSVVLLPVCVGSCTVNEIG